MFTKPDTTTRDDTLTFAPISVGDKHVAKKLLKMDKKTLAHETADLEMLKVQSFMHRSHIKEDELTMQRALELSLMPDPVHIDLKHGEVDRKSAVSKTEIGTADVHKKHNLDTQTVIKTVAVASASQTIPAQTADKNLSDMNKWFDMSRAKQQFERDMRVAEQALMTRPIHDMGSVCASLEDGMIFIVLNPYLDRPIVTRDMQSQFAMDISDFKSAMCLVPSTKRYVHVGEYGFIALEGKCLRVYVHEDMGTHQIIYILRDKKFLSMMHFRVWPDWSSGRYTRFMCIKPSMVHQTFTLDAKCQTHIHNEHDGPVSYWIQQNRKELVSSSDTVAPGPIQMVGHYLMPIEESKDFIKPTPPSGMAELLEDINTKTFLGSPSRDRLPEILPLGGTQHDFELDEDACR